MHKMKRISLAVIAPFLLLFVITTTSAQRLPSPTGFVNDFAEVISDADELRITRIAESVQRATGAEIAVATVDSLGEYASIEQFSIDLADAWGVGQAGKDNGVLIVLAELERKARIEVGYGLEGALPDGLVGRIMDTSMIPYFKNDDFGTGFLKAVEGIAGVIAKEYDVELPAVSMAESEKYARSSGTSGRGSSSLITLIIFVIVFFTGGGRFLWPLLFLGGMGRSRYTRGGFGSSSRGGFGGGSFGGFSGGGFGGGGASRGF